MLRYVGGKIGKIFIWLQLRLERNVVIILEVLRHPCFEEAWSLVDMFALWETSSIPEKYSDF